MNLETSFQLLYEHVPVRSIFRFFYVSKSIGYTLNHDKVMWRHLCQRLAIYVSPNTSLTRIKDLVSLRLSHSKICIECGSIGKRRHITQSQKSVRVCSNCHNDKHGYMNVIPSTSLCNRERRMLHMRGVQPCCKLVENSYTTTFYRSSDVGDLGRNRMRFADGSLSEDSFNSSASKNGF